jgi:hypothetical protein
MDVVLLWWCGGGVAFAFFVFFISLFFKLIDQLILLTNKRKIK